MHCSASSCNNIVTRGTCCQHVAAVTAICAVMVPASLAQRPSRRPTMTWQWCRSWLPCSAQLPKLHQRLHGWQMTARNGEHTGVCVIPRVLYLVEKPGAHFTPCDQPHPSCTTAVCVFNISVKRYRGGAVRTRVVCRRCSYSTAQTHCVQRLAGLSGQTTCRWCLLLGLNAQVGSCEVLLSPAPMSMKLSRVQRIACGAASC